jgi:predicted ATPase/DNA-binding SARP family transcriptional activator
MAVTVELALLSRVTYGSLEITGSRRQGLLALLAEDPHVGCSTSRLVDGLWPDEQPEHPVKALQVLVSRVRARLGPGVIVSTPGGYRLALREDQIDASAVLLSAAESEQRSRAGDHLAALRHAEAGLALCQGAAAWDSADDGADGHPLSALRAARAPVYRSLLRARALALSRLGRRAEAAAPLGELILRFPRDEELLAELLRCEAATAGPAAALARYAAYRQRLRDELGSDPGPALQGVHAELLQADAPVIRRGVRHEPNPLLGRDYDIAAVAALLRTSRVTSIVGTGGLGKTRLAHAVSARAEQRVVHVVELAGVAAGGDVTAEVASALGVGEEGANPVGANPVGANPVGANPVGGSPVGRRGGPPGLPAGIVTALGPGPALLVLDNCEHVAAGAADLVRALVALSKDLRVLTTSRAPLGLSSESVYLLPELDLPTTAELFEQRARAARPDADLPAQAVRELCGRLDGLPLAAELAAARVRVMSVAEIARRLDDGFAVLRGGARDAPPRHRTLHAVIDWSWDLLEPAGQAAMRALSVFPGGFTGDAARHLLGADVLPVLEQLADQSLVKVADTASGTRYQMLETVREFAVARREDAAETDDVTGRFLAWARDFGVARHDSVLTGDDLPVLELIRAEQDNLVQALGLGLGRKDGAAVAAVSAVLGGLWTVESSFARLAALAGDTARILPPFRPEPALVESTRTSLVLGAVAGFLLRGPSPARFLVGLRRLPPAPPDTFARAAQAVLTALAGSPEADLATLHALGDSDQPLVAGMATYMASYIWEEAGDASGALAAARRSLAAFERGGSAWLRAGAHARIGELCLEVDEASSGNEALRHLTAALSVIEAFGAWSTANRLREAIVGANLQRGAYDEAERELKLTTPHGPDEPWDMSMFDITVRAQIALGRGDVDTGLDLWRTAAAALRDKPRPGPGGDLSRLDPWALQVQAAAVVAHAHHDRLDLVAEITAALPAALSALTANPGAPPGTLGASYDLAVCGSLLLALAMTDIDRGQRAADAGWARSGARMIALAERFGLRSGLQRTMSAGRARRAAQDADGPAYADAVSSYAGLDPEELRAAARAILTERALIQRLGDLPAVSGHREDVRDDKDAEAPGQGGPDAGADRPLGQQVADRVNDRRHRLVVGEGAHRPGHRPGRDKGRTDERQEDQRIGKRPPALSGLRGQAGDDGNPGQRQGEQDDDADDSQPGQRARARAEPDRERDEHHDHERDQGGDHGGQHVRPQHAGAPDRQRLESLEDSGLQVREEPERGVGDAGRDRDQQDSGQQVVDVRPGPRPGVDRAAEHVPEQQHEGDRRDRDRDDGVRAARDVAHGPPEQDGGVAEEVRAHRGSLAVRAVGAGRAAGAGDGEEDVFEARLLLDVGDLGRREELFQFGEGAVGDDPPLMQDRDPVGEVFGLVQVLRGEQHRDALPGELPDAVPHLDAGLRVEPGGRLVQEDHRRLPDEAHGDVQAAAHAAGIRRHPPARRVGEAEAGQQVVRDLAGPLQVPQPGHQDQVLPPGEDFVHGRELPGKADGLPHTPRLRGDVEAVDGGRPRVGLEQRGQDFHDRGLARAVGAEQGEDAAPRHVEVHAAQRAHLLVGLLQTLHVDRLDRLRGHRLCRHRPALHLSPSPRPGGRDHVEGCTRRHSSRFHGGFIGRPARDKP